MQLDLSIIFSLKVSASFSKDLLFPHILRLSPLKTGWHPLENNGAEEEEKTQTKLFFTGNNKALAKENSFKFPFIAGFYLHNLLELYFWFISLRKIRDSYCRADHDRIFASILEPSCFSGYTSPLLSWCNSVPLCGTRSNSFFFASGVYSSGSLHNAGKKKVKISACQLLGFARRINCYIRKAKQIESDRAFLQKDILGSLGES